MGALVFPVGTSFREVVFEPEDRTCEACGRRMQLCDHRHRRLYTLTGAVHVVSKLAHCPDRACPSAGRTVGALAEAALAPRFWRIAWDVFAWIGFRRFKRHWTVPQIRAQLARDHAIPLSDDAVEDYIARYRTMVASRRLAPEARAEAYRDVDDLVLMIDGIRPDAGPETLYVVRELRAGRAWFAELLAADAARGVASLMVRARDEAAALGKPVSLWMSDQDPAFVAGVAAVFPGVAHRHCPNYFRGTHTSVERPSGIPASVVAVPRRAGTG